MLLQEGGQYQEESYSVCVLFSCD